MSQKRHQEDGKARFEGNSSGDKRRKVPALRNVVMEVMKLHKVQRLMEPVLEPLIRRVVKEEVELAIRKYLTNMKWNCEKEILDSESRILQLQFSNNLSLPVFTGTRIEGEDSTTLRVALVDVITGQVVYSGPESLAKVEIVVLEGDFDGEERENWTVEEFKNNIVREREGKKPLLTGDAFFNLKEGTGLASDISFTDNSSWTRSRKFRLGARVVDYEGTRVREAKTVSFVVRDHRGELYKKHHPPALIDEVWRLEKIGKDGAFHKRLNRESVNTVKDFLTLLFLNPARLRNILGTGMSAKMWEVTVDHAQTCILDKKLYLYCSPGSQQKTGVVFSVVGQAMGLLSECQYVPIDKLSEPEKADAQNLVISAFEHWEDVVPFDDEVSLMGGSSGLSNVLYPSISPTRATTSDENKILTCQKKTGFSYPQPCVSSPDLIPSIYSMVGVSNFDDFGLHNIDTVDLRCEPTLNFPVCDTESISQSFCDDEHLDYFDADYALQAQNPSWESPADLQTAVNGFLLARSAPVEKKAQKRWRMLSSVLKWFSIRRIVAKRTHVEKVQRYC